MTEAEAPGSQAKTWPLSSTFGQEIFTSMAVTPAASDSRAASSAYSSTLPPAMDTTARAPRDSSQGRSRWRKASIPGPCRPIEFSIPLGVSAILGVGLPARGATITDLVTTAPILATSKNWASSRPAPAHPEAVRIGFGSSTWPSLVRRSTAMLLPPHRVRAGAPARSRRAGGPGRPVGPVRPAWRGSGPWRPVGRGGPGLPGRGAAAPRVLPRVPARRAQRVERDGADVVPADHVAAEHRAAHAGPDHPGHAVVPDDREDAGHAYPDAAGHRLFHQRQHRDVVAAGQGRDLPQHTHRAAGVDHVGAGLVDDLGEPVGDGPADSHRSVLGGDRGGP